MGVVVIVPKEDGFTIYWKPDMVRCPNLHFEEAKAVCAIHDEPWYNRTPCFVYGNPDIDPDFVPKRGKPCMVGKLMVEKYGCLGDQGTDEGLEVMRQIGPGQLDEYL